VRLLATGPAATPGVRGGNDPSRARRGGPHRPWRDRARRTGPRRPLGDRLPFTITRPG